MTRDEILRGVGEVAREQVGFDGPLEPGMDLVEDLALDSIRLLTLAVEVENRFRVCLDEEDEAAITTVGDLVAAVERKLAAPGKGERDPDRSPEQEPVQAPDQAPDREQGT